MTVTCTNGHQSTATDYCDVCGDRIDGPSADPVVPAGTDQAGATPDPSAAGGGSPDPGGSPAAPSGASSAPKVGVPGTCPNCMTAYDGLTLFCEDCGYDFVVGAVPKAAAPVAPTVAGSSTTSAGPPSWLVVIGVDRAHFDRVADASVTFPEGTPDRTIELRVGDALIGRKSTSRNIHPDIDLSMPPDDVAVSRSHARLTVAPDGLLTVTDLGSSNGTRRNEASEPIAPNTPTPLDTGDRLHVGAFTRLTVVRL